MTKPIFGTDEYFAQCYPSGFVRDLYSVWLWEYPADKTDEEAFWAWCAQPAEITLPNGRKSSLRHVNRNLGQSSKPAHQATVLP